jgi:hypothetical protein
VQHVFDAVPTSFYVPANAFASARAGGRSASASAAAAAVESHPVVAQFCKRFNAVAGALATVHGNLSEQRVAASLGLRMPAKHAAHNLWLVKPAAPATSVSATASSESRGMFSQALSVMGIARGWTSFSFDSAATALGGASGTLLCNTLDDIRNALAVTGGDLVIQKYIERPLLVSARKTTVRLFALVRDSQDVFVYHEGFLMLAQAPFSLLSASAPGVTGPGQLEAVHAAKWPAPASATQQQQATMQMQQQAAEGVAPQLVPSVFPLSDLQRYIDNTAPGVYPPSAIATVVVPRMKRILVDAVRGAFAASLSLHDAFGPAGSGSAVANDGCQHPRAGHRGRRCFELFGVDFLLDEDLRPWLMGFVENPAVDVSGIHGGLGGISTEAAQSTAATVLGAMLDEVPTIVVDPLFPAATPQDVEAAWTRDSAPPTGAVAAAAALPRSPREKASMNAYAAAYAEASGRIPTGSAAVERMNVDQARLARAQTAATVNASASLTGTVTMPNVGCSSDEDILCGRYRNSGAGIFPGWEVVYRCLAAPDTEGPAFAPACVAVLSSMYPDGQVDMDAVVGVSSKPAKGSKKSSAPPLPAETEAAALMPPPRARGVRTIPPFARCLGLVDPDLAKPRLGWISAGPAGLPKGHLVVEGQQQLVDSLHARTIRSAASAFKAGPDSPAGVYGGNAVRDLSASVFAASAAGQSASPSPPSAAQRVPAFASAADAADTRLAMLNQAFQLGQQHGQQQLARMVMSPNSQTGMGVNTISFAHDRASPMMTASQAQLQGAESLSLFQQPGRASPPPATLQLEDIHGQQSSIDGQGSLVLENSLRGGYRRIMPATRSVSPSGRPYDEDDGRPQSPQMLLMLAKSGRRSPTTSPTRQRGRIGVGSPSAQGWSSLSLPQAAAEMPAASAMPSVNAYAVAHHQQQQQQQQQQQVATGGLSLPRSMSPPRVMTLASNVLPPRTLPARTPPMPRLAAEHEVANGMATASVPVAEPTVKPAVYAYVTDPALQLHHAMLRQTLPGGDMPAQFMSLPVPANLSFTDSAAAATQRPTTAAAAPGAPLPIPPLSSISVQPSMDALNALRSPAAEPAGSYGGAGVGAFTAPYSHPSSVLRESNIPNPSGFPNGAPDMQSRHVISVDRQREVQAAAMVNTVPVAAFFGASQGAVSGPAAKTGMGLVPAASVPGLAMESANNAAYRTAVTAGHLLQPSGQEQQYPGMNQVSMGYPHAAQGQSLTAAISTGTLGQGKGAESLAMSSNTPTAMTLSSDRLRDTAMLTSYRTLAGATVSGGFGKAPMPMPRSPSSADLYGTEQTDNETEPMLPSPIPVPAKHASTSRLEPIVISKTDEDAALDFSMVEAKAALNKRQAEIAMTFGNASEMDSPNTQKRQTSITFIPAPGKSEFISAALTMNTTMPSLAQHDERPAGVILPVPGPEVSNTGPRAPAAGFSGDHYGFVRHAGSEESGPDGENSLSAKLDRWLPRTAAAPAHASAQDTRPVSEPAPVPARAAPTPPVQSAVARAKSPRLAPNMTLSRIYASGGDGAGALGLEPAAQTFERTEARAAAAAQDKVSFSANTVQSPRSTSIMQHMAQATKEQFTSPSARPALDGFDDRSPEQAAPSTAVLPPGYFLPSDAQNRALDQQLRDAASGNITEFTDSLYEAADAEKRELAASFRAHSADKGNADDMASMEYKRKLLQAMNSVMGPGVLREIEEGQQNIQQMAQEALAEARELERERSELYQEPKQAVDQQTRPNLDPQMLFSLLQSGGLGKLLGNLGIAAPGEKPAKKKKAQKRKASRSPPRADAAPAEAPTLTETRHTESQIAPSASVHSYAIGSRPSTAGSSVAQSTKARLAAVQPRVNTGQRARSPAIARAASLVRAPRPPAAQPSESSVIQHPPFRGGGSRYIPPSRSVSPTAQRRKQEPPEYSDALRNSALSPHLLASNHTEPDAKAKKEKGSAKASGAAAKKTGVRPSSSIVLSAEGESRGRQREATEGKITLRSQSVVLPSGSMIDPALTFADSAAFSQTRDKRVHFEAEKAEAQRRTVSESERADAEASAVVSAGVTQRGLALLMESLKPLMADANASEPGNAESMAAVAALANSGALAERLQKVLREAELQKQHETAAGSPEPKHPVADRRPSLDLSNEASAMQRSGRADLSSSMGSLGTGTYGLTGAQHRATMSESTKVPTAARNTQAAASRFSFLQDIMELADATPDFVPAVPAPAPVAAHAHTELLSENPGSRPGVSGYLRGEVTTLRQIDPSFVLNKGMPNASASYLANPTLSGSGSSGMSAAAILNQYGGTKQQPQQPAQKPAHAFISTTGAGYPGSDSAAVYRAPVQPKEASARLALLPYPDSVASAPAPAAAAVSYVPSVDIPLRQESRLPPAQPQTASARYSTGITAPAPAATVPIRVPLSAQQGAIARHYTGANADSVTVSAPSLIPKPSGPSGRVQMPTAAAMAAKAATMVVNTNAPKQVPAQAGSGVSSYLGKAPGAALATDPLGYASTVAVVPTSASAPVPSMALPPAPARPALPSAAPAAGKPLPQALWVEVDSAAGKYYYHTLSRETRWQKPAGPDVMIVTQGEVDSLARSLHMGQGGAF